jgi:hypothetical protein
MSNVSFSADRCRGTLRIDDNAHVAGRGDADIAASPRRCANRRRYRSGTRRPRSWSRAYGARRSWPSLRLGQRPRAPLWMVTRQTSRLGLNPISPFAVVALVATTLGVKVGWQEPSGQQFGRRSIVAPFSTPLGMPLHNPVDDAEQDAEPHFESRAGVGRMRRHASFAAE